MQPEDRTKLLVGVLGGILGLWLGWGLVKKSVYTPIKSRNQKIAELDDELQKAKAESDAIDMAKLRLAKWRSMSPPPNPDDAQRLYKEWVRDLVQMTGFVDPTFESRSMTPKKQRRMLVYTAVPVTVKGKVTFPQLCKFLYYFHRTELMHRITDLDITSEGNEGNPLMSVRITCEAVTLPRAIRRQRLFPETKLKTPLESDKSAIAVSGAKGFPKKGPFHVRIGEQFLTVTDVDGTNWKIRPGIDPPPQNEIDSLKSAEVGAVVQLNRMSLDKNSLFAGFRKSVYGRYANPFVLPMEFSPSLRINGDKRLARGDKLRLKAEARDLDPDKGKPKYALGKNAPKGMTIDEKSGDIRWSPAKDAAPKSYRAEVMVYQGGERRPLLTESFSVEIRVPNNRPSITVAKDSHEIFVGETVNFLASAKDPDDHRLSFSLSGAPAGATIDSRSGKFEWKPDDDAEPKMYSFDVVVIDSGSPAQSDKKTVFINVKQKAERYTKLIGIFTEGPQREAWFYDIANSKKITLTEGSPFEVAGISGFLYVIGQEFIEFQSGDTSFRLPLGKFLSDRQKLIPKSAAKSPK